MLRLIPSLYGGNTHDYAFHDVIKIMVAHYGTKRFIDIMVSNDPALLPYLGPLFLRVQYEFKVRYVSMDELIRLGGDIEHGINKVGNALLRYGHRWYDMLERAPDDAEWSEWFESKPYYNVKVANIIAYDSKTLIIDRNCATLTLVRTSWCTRLSVTVRMKFMPRAEAHIIYERRTINKGEKTVRVRDARIPIDDEHPHPLALLSIMLNTARAPEDLPADLCRLISPEVHEPDDVFAMREVLYRLRDAFGAVWLKTIHNSEGGGKRWCILADGNIFVVGDDATGEAYPGGSPLLGDKLIDWCLFDYKEAPVDHPIADKSKEDVAKSIADGALDGMPGDIVARAMLAVI